MVSYTEPRRLPQIFNQRQLELKKSFWKLVFHVKLLRTLSIISRTYDTKMVDRIYGLWKKSSLWNHEKRNNKINEHKQSNAKSEPSKNLKNNSGYKFNWIILSRVHSHRLKRKTLEAYFIKQLNPSLKPLSANPTKWSNTTQTIRRLLTTNYLSVFDHFVGLALKGLMINLTAKYTTF